MYFLMDPNKKQEMWLKLEKSLTTEKNCFVITDGIYNPNASSKVISLEDARKFITKLKNLDYVRIGISKNYPLPPYFAIKCCSKTEVKIIEYITLTNQFDNIIDEKKIKKDLYLIADIAFFEKSDLKKILFPSKLNPEISDIYQINIDENISILSKI